MNSRKVRISLLALIALLSTMSCLGFNGLRTYETCVSGSAEVEGTIMIAFTNEPVSGATITVRSMKNAEEFLCPNGWRLREPIVWTTDENGRYGGTIASHFEDMLEMRITAEDCSERVITGKFAFNDYGSGGWDLYLFCLDR